MSKKTPKIEFFNVTPKPQMHPLFQALSSPDAISLTRCFPRLSATGCTAHLSLSRSWLIGRARCLDSIQGWADCGGCFDNSPVVCAESTWTFNYLCFGDFTNLWQISLRRREIWGRSRVGVPVTHHFLGGDLVVRVALVVQRRALLVALVLVNGNRTWLLCVDWIVASLLRQALQNNHSVNDVLILGIFNVFLWSTDWILHKLFKAKLEFL